METKLFIFLLAVSLCNGHLPFGNIISSTHSKIHEVAGGILGGIAHGLNINLEGNIGVKTEHGSHQSNYGSTKPPEETIVVIVEEGANPNDYNRPPGNHRPHQNQPRPPFSNNGVYGPGYNEYSPHQHRPGRPHHHGNEDFNNNGNYNNYNQGGSNEYGRPHNYNNNQYGNKPNRYPNYPNQEYPNYGRPQYPPQPNGNNGPNDQYGGNNNNGYNPRPNFGNNNNGYNPRPNFGNNNNCIPSQPPPYNNNNQQNNNENYPNYNDANNGNANPNGNQFNNNPTTQFSTKQPVPTVKPSEKPTQPDSDIPLFIPLLPDESKNVTAPKRETDDSKSKPAEDMDEEFQLDIRIKE